MAGLLPRKIHFIRINAPVSKDEETLLVEWIRLNPAYEISVWVEPQYIEEMASALIQGVMSVETVKSMQSRDGHEGSEIQIRLNLDKGRELNWIVRSVWTVPSGAGEIAFRHEMTPPKNIASAVDTLKLRILYWFGGIYFGMNVSTPPVTQPQHVMAPQDILIGMVPRGDCMELQDCILAAVPRSSKMHSLLTMVDARNKVIMVEPFPEQLMRDPNSAFSRWAKDNLESHMARLTWRHDVLKEAEGGRRSGVMLLADWLQYTEHVSLSLIPVTPPQVVDPRSFDVSSSSDEEQSAEPEAAARNTLRPFDLPEPVSASVGGAMGVVQQRKKYTSTSGSGKEADRSRRAAGSRPPVVDIYSYSFQQQSKFTFWVMPVLR